VEWPLCQERDATGHQRSDFWVCPDRAPKRCSPRTCRNNRCIGLLEGCRGICSVDRFKLGYDFWNAWTHGRV